MTSETAIEIINAICDKIGIVYDKAIGLVPYIARYNIVHDVTLLFVGFAFILTGALLWRKGDKLARAEMQHYGGHDGSSAAEDYLGWFVSGGIALAIGAIVTLVHVTDLIRWIFAPEISSLKWALKLMGGN